jgi:hypothetical protein
MRRHHATIITAEKVSCCNSVRRRLASISRAAQHFR